MGYGRLVGTGRFLLLAADIITHSQFRFEDRRIYLESDNGRIVRI